MEFRLGGTGAGLFVGCGCGVGFITPLSLHSIPVLGQLASSLSGSLGSLDASLGGLGSSARRRVRSLGIRGLEAGFGCGAMIGYGYGAGLMLTPDAVHKVKATAAGLQNQLLRRMPPDWRACVKAQAAQQATTSAASRGTLLPGISGLDEAGQAAWSSPTVPGSDNLAPAPFVQKGQEQQQQQQDVGELADLMRLVLKQQNLLDDLQQQVTLLQSAVCRLDSSAPGCKTGQ